MVVYDVSEGKLRQGIMMILDNISRYLKDARLLVSDGSLMHGTLLTMYAAEELGKASLLCQVLQSGRPSIDSELFHGKDAHRRKMDRARDLVGDYAILQSSVVGKARLPFIIEAPDVEASPETREDCTYVDFREGDWKFGVTFVGNHLESILQKIDEQCSAIHKGLKSPEPAI